ncbi:hypothetical protein E4T38_07285 [Aureobasidium subglaciale]|nr:hypothetical protein E4T38_07285 [Aureobasidium subglaciale]KAI5217618.1 hypothetical protein E4T40_07296 [Aureobasidium subglaciale]KAI5221243.1 hypothetical protein E4T41_07137 [Aureobasidium subglaciale]KAI5258954.1 hypothetical protein E4T46_07114 [Aureobasidium subglaciale]
MELSSQSTNLAVLDENNNEAFLTTISSETTPRTPLKSNNNGRVQSNIENESIQVARRESRPTTLHLDTRIADSSESGSRRASPSGTIGESSASSTSNHSRQDSTASYTPLRSARGSLSLGGTAHHSHLSRRSSRSQSSVNREAWALPLANTDTLILVPDAVATRSPLCTQTSAECLETTQTQSTQSQPEPRPTRRRRKRSGRYREVRNTAILVGVLCVLLVTALSLYFAMALPKVKDIPASIHVFIIATLIVLVAFVLLFSFRLHKVVGKHKIEKSRGPNTRHRYSRIYRLAEGEESLIPNSPIAVQYEADDDVERAEQESPAVVRAPPPAYGRWRGSYRMDPELLHWRRVGEAEGEQRSSVDTAPPMYASPMRSRPEASSAPSQGEGATEMVEVGRAC